MIREIQIWPPAHLTLSVFITLSIKKFFLIAVEAGSNITRHLLRPCTTTHGGARRRPVCMVVARVAVRAATARHRPTTQSRPLCRIGYPTHRRATGTLARCTDPLPTGTYPLFLLPSLTFACFTHFFPFPHLLNFPLLIRLSRYITVHLLCSNFIEKKNCKKREISKYRFFKKISFKIKIIK